jgi:RNA polymerase sigma-70 factor (ECF subfamily)
MTNEATTWTTATGTAGASTAEALIVRCLAGEERAYAELYDAYAGMIYRLVYGMLRHREDAEEVLQDAFEYAFRRLDRYDPERAAFKTWLYQIAISRCKNKRRRKWLPTFSLSEMLRPELPDPGAPAPHEVAQLSERQQAVWDALGELSEKLRATALLRYYEGMTYAEIGHVLGIPPKTAESRMRLAHRALRDALQDSEL